MTKCEKTQKETFNTFKKLAKLSMMMIMIKIKPIAHKEDDLVAIKRAQFGTGLKLLLKYYGLYRIKNVKPNERHEVEIARQYMDRI
ncbi:hypothetical protein CDAR_578661 [Caerostris darwini]|uniref:Uncharacterized protein n=1 Tax=Caerostris darwini TaxID=1538125 RepID=A0AAV4UC31_9ARAC|nr:hypothetical protein CDAR_578661 [Caerostris darwini]